MEKRKHRKLTAEDIARHQEHQRWARERIAYHEAKAREEDERRAEKRRS